MEQNSALRHYARYVEKCRTRKTITIIPNSSVARASVMIENLLTLAADEKLPIRLLSGELAREVYDRVVPNVVRAIESGCDLQVVVHKILHEEDGNRFFNIIRKIRPNAVRFLNLPLDAKTHFMLVGDSAYRIEIDDVTRQASGCFNDATGILVPALQQRFVDSWDQAIESEQTREEHALA